MIINRPLLRKKDDFRFMAPTYETNLPLSSYSLDELLPNSLLSSPSVSIRTVDVIGDAAGLLAHHLESFTDSLVVTKDYSPVGILGGIEFLGAALKNPSFSDKTPVGEIMNDELLIITKQTTLSELLKRWQETRRAFAIAPNQYSGYSAISARKLLEVGASCKTDMTISDIPKKEICTFTKNYTIGDIIKSMFEKKTRKLILENTSLFISDRIIIEKIASNLEYLRHIASFLRMKASILKLESAKTVSENLKIPEVCKIMIEMKHPYVIAKDHVISPWDIVVILASNKLLLN